MTMIIKTEMIEVEAKPGSVVNAFLQEVYEFSCTNNITVKAKFNGKEFLVTPYSSVEKMLEWFYS